MPLPSGTRLGHYEIIDLIGAGGMGEVYKARDPRLNRTVAVKVLLKAVSEKPEASARFEREARTIAGVHHPHICVVYDVGRQDNTDFLVMEFLEGETLASCLERGRLPLNQALKFAMEIADALDKAHRNGVTHRDLKPGNIMITRDGVKLLDFGLAKLRDNQNFSTYSQAPTKADVTEEGTIVGSLQYMAPEQLEGREADARTDLFAFGATLHEMVTGQKAFEGKSSISLMSAILKDTPEPITALQPVAPETLERVITTCLAKDPDDRWQSARDLYRELKWGGGRRCRRRQRRFRSCNGRRAGVAGSSCKDCRGNCRHRDPYYWIRCLDAEASCAAGASRYRSPDGRVRTGRRASGHLRTTRCAVLRR